VANRVGEIQNITEPGQWRYVPTDKNPADLLSRGVTVTNLIASDKWWDGPTFISMPPSEWPENKIDAPKQTGLEIRKQYLKENELPDITTLVSNDAVDMTVENKLDPTRYSSWIRLTRVCAWVIRFVDNCRLPSLLRQHGQIAPHEIVDTESHFIKLAQVECFSDELKSLQNKKTNQIRLQATSPQTSVG